ncbi:MAG: 7-keto-8-aminopelargonate synthetase-like enzyme/predicted N-acyltransferase [Crocinitomicaceae bacterium]|jgi:7-keto-8-aminopelargonate synthetase-like enzyme/predicted N-acyltransferase
MSDKTINLVNDIVLTAEKRGVARLVIENESSDGKMIILENKELVSFGSYSYLGLEIDERLKKAAIQAIEKFGLQYPSSRVYTSLPMYVQLEEMFREIFGAPVLLTTSLSLGHAGVMPVLINREDVLILDQHVHSSVQDAAQRLKAKGCKLTMLRHNDLDALENNIIELSKKHPRVWYAIDGIYSMYGDVAPMKELEVLLNRYDSFYLYVDDAHGVSSYGKNGAGWVLSQIEFHKKMVLSTGMAKAFGTMGGVFAIRDPDLFEITRNCTGSLIFSGPHPIPILGASLASAQIHLSEEIVVRQNLLADKIYYCHKLLADAGLPDISHPLTPIFFIALGLIRVGYNLVKKMIDDGFYVNLASFPAVSESCTGIRFTITLHHSMADIENLVTSLVENYPMTLQEEGVSMQDIRKAFRKTPNFPKDTISIITKPDRSLLSIIYAESIAEIGKEKWNGLHADSSLLNWNFLNLLESVFKENIKKEDNWNFHYFQINDAMGSVVVSTVFTSVLVKEDMLSPKDVSNKLESEREDNPYFLSSNILMMGTLVTEGTQIYINRQSPEWQMAMRLLFRELERLKDNLNINSIFLRDFVVDDNLFDFLREESYLKVELPDSHNVISFNWNDEASFISQFKKHRKQYLKKIVMRNQDQFEVEIIQMPKSDQIKEFYNLYKNVNNKSDEINTFDLPEKLFHALLENGQEWELIRLSLEVDSSNAVAMMLCHKSSKVYTPLFVGLDYTYLSSNIYPAILWQTLKRANQLEVEMIPLGFTASQIKRKFGADSVPKFGFVKAKDNFDMMQVNLFH